MVNGIFLYKNLDIYSDSKKIEKQEKIDVDKSTSTKRSTEAKGGDVIKLSSEAQTLSKVKNAMNEVSEVRKDKVEEIKNKIQSGEYNINSKELAVKLLNEII